MPTRDPRLDTIKGALIVTVVFGHVIEVVPALASWLRGGPWSLIYTGIYLFHMPAFVFVSGYLTSPRKTIGQSFRDVFLLYVVAQLAWVAFSVGLSWFGGPRQTWLDVTGVLPGWGLWYLLSLFVWRALAPRFANCRNPVAWLIGMSAVAITLGETPLNSLFSASRTLTFMPFFAAGMWSRQHGWGLAAKGWRPRDLLLMAPALAAAPIAALFAYRHWIPETQLAEPFSPRVGHLGIAFRAGMFLVGFAAIRALFAFVPTRRVASLTGLGERTLSVYIAEFYILQPLCVLVPFAWWHPHMKYIAVPLTVAICAGAAWLNVGAWLEAARTALDRTLARFLPYYPRQDSARG